MNDCIVCLRDNLHVESLPRNAVCARHWKEAVLAMIGHDTRFRSAGIPLSVQARQARRVRAGRAI